MTPPLSPPLCSALSPGPSGLGVLIRHMGGRRAAGHVGEASFAPMILHQGKEQRWRTLAFPPHTIPGKAGPTRATMSPEKPNRIPAVSVTKTAFCASVYLVPKDRGGCLCQRMMHVFAPTHLIACPFVWTWCLIRFYNIPGGGLIPPSVSGKG